MELVILYLCAALFIFGAAFALGYVFGQTSAITESHDQQQRAMVADMWMQAINNLGGDDEQANTEKPGAFD